MLNLQGCVWTYPQHLFIKVQVIHVISNVVPLILFTKVIVKFLLKMNGWASVLFRQCFSVGMTGSSVPLAYQWVIWLPTVAHEDIPICPRSLSMTVSSQLIATIPQQLSLITDQPFAIYGLTAYRMENEPSELMNSGSPNPPNNAFMAL